MARESLKTPLDFDPSAAIRNAKKAAEAAKGFGKSGKKAGEETARGMKGAAAAGDRLTSVGKQLIGAWAGWAGISRLIASAREELQRIEETSRRAIESMRGLMALSNLGMARPELRKQLFGLSTTFGVPMERLAPAYYTLAGGTAGMSPERRRGLMTQALLMGKTDTRADLESMVSLFSAMGMQQPGLTPLQIGNLASRTIEQAKATPSEMAEFLPTVLSTAVAGKVEVPTAMAMFAFASRMGGGVAKSGTAVRSTMLGLINMPKDRMQKMRRFGFRPEWSLMQKISWLAEQGGRLPEELAAQLGGRRGIEAVSAIAAQPEVFRQEVSTIREALAAPASLFRERLAGMYGEQPAQAMVDAGAQIAALREQHRTRDEVLLGEQGRDMLDLITEREGMPLALRKGREWGLTTMQALLGGERAGRLLQPTRQAYVGLLARGWTPKQIAEVVAPKFPSANLPRFPLRPGVEMLWRTMAKEGRVPELITEMEATLREAGEEPVQEGGGLELPGDAPTTQPVTTQPATVIINQPGVQFNTTPANVTKAPPANEGRIGE